MPFNTIGTWDLVALPIVERTVGCKWVFKVKYLADSLVDRYKARLVAKDFTQISGKDFGANFVPITPFTFWFLSPPFIRGLFTNFEC